MFTNLQNAPHVTGPLVEYGYDEARYEEGRNLRTAVETLFRKYLEKRQERIGKYAELMQAFRQVTAVYMGHVKRLRKELPGEPETYAELGLAGERDRTIAGIIEQAINFYNTALKPETLTKIQRFGFTAVKLETDLSDINKYQSVRAAYEQLKGECQSLVEERDKAFKKLRAWVGAFIATCKVVFAGSLQTLEEVGIFIRNQPKPKPKEENQAPDDSADVETDTGTNGTD